MDLATAIQRHWDWIWGALALIVEAMLLLWMRGNLEAWALTTAVTLTAWVLAWTARLWQESQQRPDWLMLTVVLQLVGLGVVVGLASQASDLSPEDYFWYLPTYLAGIQMFVPILVSRRI